MRKVKTLICLVLIMYLACVTAVGAPVTGNVGDGVVWSFDEKESTLIIDGTGAMTDYTLASKTPWYSFGDKIKTVKVLDGVIKVGSNAFGELYNLESVFLGESVSIIAEDAFMNSDSLSELYFYGDIKAVGTGAFSGCTSLRSLNFGKTVGMIDPLAFKGVRRCVSYNVNEGNLTYTSVDGVVFTKDKKTLVMYPVARNGEYSIPELTEAVGDYAFYRAINLSAVTIEETVKTLGNYAFGNCTALEKINLSDKTERIGEFVFSNCSALKEFKIPQFETIPTGFLAGCEQIKEIEIPDSVKVIGDYAFNSMGFLEKLVLPEKTETIGDFALSGCNKLKYIYIPVSVKSIGKQTLWFESGVTEIVYQGSESEWRNIDGQSNIRLWFKILHTNKDVVFEG